MQLKALKIFCDIVRRRSFSLAAVENGISQSSASQVVHQLEEQLGLRLLDRSKRPFIPTAEGKLYYEGCQQLVKQYGKLVDEVHALHDQTTGHLRVASIYSVGLAHMSAFMRRFSASYPGSQVHLDYLRPELVYDAVDKGEADLGLVSYPEDSRNLAVTAWRDESLVLVCHPTHKFAKQSSVELGELETERFVAFESRLRIRSEIDRLLMVGKVHVEAALEFDNIETIKRAIEINEGVSILPEPTVDWEVATGLLAKVMLEGESFRRPLGIIHRRDQELGSIGKQFVRMLQSDSNIDTTTIPTPIMSLRETPTRVL